MRNPMLNAFAAAAVGATLLFSAAASAEMKVGAIRVPDLLLQSPQYKAGQDKMKSEFEKRQKDFEGDYKKFQADAEKFTKEKDLLSTGDRSKQEKDLTTRQLDLNYKKQQLQEDMQNRSQQLEQEMGKKIQDAISQFAKDQGYDLIVRDPVFASNAVDITDEVLKKLQASGDAAAPAAKGKK